MPIAFRPDPKHTTRRMDVHVSNQLDLLLRGHPAHWNERGISSTPHDQSEADSCGLLGLCNSLEQPLQQLPVLVGSRGMASWLQRRCADVLGNASILNPLLPAQFFEQHLFHEFTQEKEHSSLGTENSVIELSWRILAAFEQDDKPHSLALYLQTHNASLQRWRLARRLADIFDRYRMTRLQRPELSWDLARWNNAENTHSTSDHHDWQIWLWQTLRKDGLADPVEEFTRALDFVQNKKLEKLAPSLAVFAVNTIPPLFLRLLQAIDQKPEHRVHIFCWQPLYGIWDDQLKQKQLADHQERQEVNRLLGDWGMQGREFLGILAEETHLDHLRDAGFYNSQSPNSALGRLQESCFKALSLQDNRFSPDNYYNSEEQISQDQSLQILSCFNPQRECEELRDVIINGIQQHNWKADDIVILSPQPKKYAPYFQAACQALPQLDLPISVADTSFLSQNNLAQCIIAIIKFASGRMPLNAALALLQNDLIKRSWKLSTYDIQHIDVLLRSVGIRRFRDGEHRHTEYLHQDSNLGEKNDHSKIQHIHTWRHGLQRLRLSLFCGEQSAANPSLIHDKKLGILFPMLRSNDTMASNSNNNALLQCLDIFTLCLQLADFAQHQHGWNNWLQKIDELSQRFQYLVEDDEFARFNQTLHKSRLGFDELAQRHPALLHALDGPSAHALLEDIFNERSGGSFIRGRITLCAMQPMRCIPFKVICFLGMNENDFPRRLPQDDLDLIQHDLHPGDRHPPKEDRYLFLETILNAQEHCIITYCGRDQYSNEDQEPSLLVRELQDALEELQCHKNNYKAKACPLHHHQKNPIFTEDLQRKNAIQHPLNRDTSNKTNCATLDDLNEITFTSSSFYLEDILQSWAHLAKSYCQAHGLRPRLPESLDQDFEAVEFKGLEAFQAKETLLHVYVNNTSEEEANTLATQSGLLPFGAPGQVALTAHSKLLQELAAIAVNQKHRFPQHAYSLQLANNASIHGLIPDFKQQDRDLDYVIISRLHDEQLFIYWIKHVFCAALGFKNCTVLHTLNSEKQSIEQHHYLPLEQTTAKELIEVFLKISLLNKEKNVPFFPSHSRNISKTKPRTFKADDLCSYFNKDYFECAYQLNWNDVKPENIAQHLEWHKRISPLWLEHLQAGIPINTISESAS